MPAGWKLRLVQLAKEAAYQAGVSRGVFHRYPYLFRPAQLAFLVQCLEQTRDIEGSVGEVGCGQGHTTVFMKEHLRDAGIDKRHVCIDTFSGFTERDIQHEVIRRGKTEHQATYRTEFTGNKRKWVERTLEINGASRVEVLEADASTFDYRSISPIAFALVDVDLYLPVKASLDAIYGELAPGGVIVVDDCRQRVDVWDGAAQAYGEFVAEHGLPHGVVLDKLGLLEKPVDRRSSSLTATVATPLSAERSQGRSTQPPPHRRR